MTQRRILRPPAVRDLTAISDSQRDRLERAGKFPRRVRIVEGGRAVGYFSDEIEAWINARENQRAADVPPDIGADPRRRGVGRHKGGRGVQRRVEDKTGAHK